MNNDERLSHMRERLSKKDSSYLAEIIVECDKAYLKLDAENKKLKSSVEFWKHVAKNLKARYIPTGD